MQQSDFTGIAPPAPVWLQVTFCCMCGLAGFLLGTIFWLYELKQADWKAGPVTLQYYRKGTTWTASDELPTTLRNLAVVDSVTIDFTIKPKRHHELLPSPSGTVSGSGSVLPYSPDIYNPGAAKDTLHQPK